MFRYLLVINCHKLQVEEQLTLHCNHATHSSEHWKDLERTLGILSYHTCLQSGLDFTNLAGSLFTKFQINTYTYDQKYGVTVIHFNSVMEEDREECPVSSGVSLKSDVSIIIRYYYVIIRWYPEESPHFIFFTSSSSWTFIKWLFNQVLYTFMYIAYVAIMIVFRQFICLHLSVKNMRANSTEIKNVLVENKNKVTRNLCKMM